MKQAAMPAGLAGGDKGKSRLSGTFGQSVSRQTHLTAPWRFESSPYSKKRPQTEALLFYWYIRVLINGHIHRLNGFHFGHGFTNGLFYPGFESHGRHGARAASAQ